MICKLTLVYYASFLVQQASCAAFYNVLAPRDEETCLAQDILVDDGCSTPDLDPDTVQLPMTPAGRPVNGNTRSGISPNDIVATTKHKRAQWRQAQVDAGKALFDSLQQRLAEPEPTNKLPLCQLENWSRQKPRDDKLVKAPELENLLSDGLIPSPQPEATFYRYVVRFPKECSTNDWDQAWNSAMSPSYGIIQTRRLLTRPRPGTEPPDSWADVNFRLWLSLCRKYSKPVKGLKVIVREDNMDEGTLSIIDDVIGENDVAWNMGAARGTFTRPTATVTESLSMRDKAFFALLQTPYMKDVVEMLQSYPKALGKKNIKAISIAKMMVTGPVEACWIWVELEDFSSPDAQSVGNTRPVNPDPLAVD